MDRPLSGEEEKMMVLLEARDYSYHYAYRSTWIQFRDFLESGSGEKLLQEIYENAIDRSRSQAMERSSGIAT